VRILDLHQRRRREHRQAARLDRSLEIVRGEQPASADLDELLRYSDRILVFFAGKVLREVRAADTSGEELGYLIGGKVAP